MGRNFLLNINIHNLECPTIIDVFQCICPKKFFKPTSVSFKTGIKLEGEAVAMSLIFMVVVEISL